MNARPLALVVLLAVLGGGIFYATRPRESPVGLDQLARLAPQDARLFLALDVRGLTSTPTILARLMKFLEGSPEALHEWRNAEKRLGVKADEISRWSTPAGFLVVVPTGAVMGFPVTDAHLAREDIQKVLALHGPPTKPEVKGNFSIYEQAGWGLVGTTLMLGTSAAALEQVQATCEGRAPNLTALPAWRAARQKVKADSGVLVFSPLESTPWELAGARLDDQTRKGLSALQYGVAAAWIEGDALSLAGFLGIDPQSTSPFARALVTPSNTIFTSAALAPADYETWSAYDLHYLFRVAVAALQMFPETRGQTEAGLSQLQAVVGFSIEDDLFGGFTGEVGYTSNLLSKLAGLAHSSTSGESKRAQMTECKSNLKNLATGCEMYSTDFNGLYPTELELLTPNYLKTLPTCPAAGLDTYSSTYSVATRPDLFTLVCSGKHHVQANYPQYSSTDGLDEGPREPSAAETAPSGLVIAPIKDQARAEKLLARLAPLMTWKAGGKVGDVQLYTYPGAVKAIRGGNQPVLLLAHGDEAEEVITEALTTKTPVSATAEYRQAANDHATSWVSCSYLNLTPLKQLLSDLLASAQIGQQLLDSYPLGVGLTYVVAEPDGLRLASFGKGTAELALGSTGIVAAILVPNFIRARSQGQFTACKSNLKNIGTALEMYSTDYAGRYPPELAQLTPNYLTRLPTCPSCGSMTYLGATAAQPDMYTVVCGGENHAALDLPANYPQYNAVEGLVERP